MKRLFLLFFLIIQTSLIYSQKKEPAHYSQPFSSNYNPITVRVNVVLLKRTDGTGSYDLNKKDELEAFMGFLDVANQSYKNIQPLTDNFDNCYTGTDFYSDTKIRLDFNVIEIKNNYAWNYLNSGSDIKKNNLLGFSPSEKWYLKSLSDSLSNAQNIPKGILVYFTEDGEIFDEVLKVKAKDQIIKTKAASQFPSSNKLDMNSQIHIPNRYMKFLVHKYQAPKIYNTTWDETIKWHTNEGKSLAHELGHSFGLGHANEYHKANACPHSLMHQRNSESTKDYLQPTEIKKIHWNLTRTNLMQFVTEDSHYGVSWKIEQNTNWDKQQRFYNDFELEDDVILTISDKIILPPQAQIKLNKNAQIIFKDKGEIVDAHGKKFNNFKLHKRAKITKV